jgi:hypothetical protein
MYNRIKINIKEVAIDETMYFHYIAAPKSQHPMPVKDCGRELDAADSAGHYRLQLNLNKQP